MTIGSLLLRFAIAFTVLVAVELSYGARVRKSFIPERTFAAAAAEGDDCVLTLGDSRMVAGVSSELLASELRREQSARCHAGLAIGGGDIVAHYFALRRYLETGRRPKLVVLGTTLESMLEKDAPPETLIGNQAVVLGWSRPADVSLLYPGFPAERFDHGFRFLAMRPLATTAYGSLAWARVQALQDGIVGKADGRANQFGLVADMQALARSLKKDVEERISGFPERVSLHPALPRLFSLAAARGVPTLLVELPMPSSYRAALERADRAPRLRAAARELVTRSGGTMVDLGHPIWLVDEFFDDGLHLGSDGRELFTRDLGREATRALGQKPGR